MGDITSVFVIVAKLLIYMGATMFIICFVMGAWTFYQIFSTTLYTMKVAKMWNDYRKLSPEAKLEAVKDKRFKD